LSDYSAFKIDAISIFVKFGGNDCILDTIALPQITCKIPTNIDGSTQINAGQHLPLLHILGIGYATYADNLKSYNVPLITSSISPSSVIFSSFLKFLIKIQREVVQAELQSI
jgi:hypothetical protein